MTNIQTPKPRTIVGAPEPGSRECDLCYQTVPDLPYCDNCGIRTDAIDEALSKCWDPPWQSSADSYIDWLSSIPI